MTGLQKFKEILLAVVIIVIALMMINDPEDGISVALLIMTITLLVDSIRIFIYFFTMARHMVGGQIIFYRAIIELDLGITALFISNEPTAAVFIYLLGFYFLSGIFAIMQARESKKLGSRWKLKFSMGILNILMSIACVVFSKRVNIIIYIYCSGLIYSSILRIINACRKTAVVYVQ